jgi:hypothetical protein
MKTVFLLAMMVPPLLAPTKNAFADDKADCLSAATRGQVLRDTHKLVEAREQFRICARQLCPAMVQQDCGGWLGEVERGVSTVVFTAKDSGGQDLMEVKVRVDGQPLVTSLDGQAVAVNPGPHVFSFDCANHAPLERQAVIKEGEKNQAVTVVLTLTSPSPLPPAPPVPGVPSESASLSLPPAPTSAPSGAMRLWGLALGGAGVAGMGVGIGLGLEAKSKDNTASGEPGAARQTDSQSAARLGNVATITFAAGAAVVAGGVVLWLLAPSPHAAIGTNGRDLLLGGSF